MKIDLNKLIKTHGGQWVALNEALEKVVSNGKDAKIVLEKAQKKGIRIPYLFKVPTKLVAYIG